ncbi:MAG: PGF-pre-PGF domain-containing protein, partial [archaeon]
MGPWEKKCYEITTRAACINSSGCTWGSCTEQGCWSYSTSTTCNAQPYCSWNSNYNYCESDSCYSPKYNAVAACSNVSDNKLCRWNSNYGGYCEQFTCHTFDYNQTGCTNAFVSFGLDCEWESSNNMCNEKGCWSYWNQADCTGKVANGKNCTWRISQMQNSGWCEKVGCWSFDNISVRMENPSGSTNQSYCEQNQYSLPCVYNANGGWCYQDISTLSCANMTDQRKCWDTMWCFWDDFANTCIDPSGGFQGGTIGGTGGGGGFKAPPCAVFYLNESNCNNVTGCRYNNSLSGTARCVTDNPSITQNGINCSLILDSSLCNSVPFLPHCCTWQGDSCDETKFDTSCWDNMATPPDGASYCEDTSAYSSESKCNKIANYPWYMPCVWNNATGTKRCEFANDLFGSGLQEEDKGDLDLIDNKQACEQGGGGVWVTESYCGTGELWNKSITIGRCTPKMGVAGGNCDISCNDCEYASSGTNQSTEAAAREACQNSDLGFCEWISDNNAPNGYGYCKSKAEFQSGAVSKCSSTNCDACNMYQSGKAKDKCIESACNWAVDPLDQTKGVCIGKGEKTCNEDCSACKNQEACSEQGRGGPEANNGQNPCTWDTSYSICKQASAGGNSNSEICFNGMDDDGDNNIDCTDSGCYTDPFCGGSSMINCFQYNNNDTCFATEGCYWFNDSFGSWCDMKSAICWQNDGNEQACRWLNDSCEWHTPPPGMDAMCDTNESVLDICSTLNNTDCSQNGNCSWFVDPWCSQTPESCGDNAGWCGHKYEICWMNNTINSNMDACNDAINTVGVGCQWVYDPMMGGGHCEPPCFSLGSNCASDPLCESISGFCDPIGFGGGGNEMFNCWQYDTDQVQCNNQTQCSWMIEQRPFCDMKMNFDCGQFGNSKVSCMANGNCTWFNQSELSGGMMEGAWCGMKFEICFMNMTLQTNSTACNQNPNCNWSSWNSCEPSMFIQGANDAQSCQQNGGLWRTGWCNPAGMAGMFMGMAMDSPPVMLGNDICPETGIPSYVDICGAGLKDSPDNWGLGIGVNDIRDAAMCNGVTTFQGLGSGTKASKFYWYLDTDGRQTGGCSLDSNTSNVGWDLLFNYLASYTDGSLSETRTAYRCVNSQWTVTNIQLNSWKEKMCNELQGAMVALNKDDLMNFEGLLNSSSNIRFYFITANGSTNSSSPVDILGPLYYTPGTIDFLSECCWALGDANLDCDADGLSPANDPNCQSMKGDGFIKFEDCWGDGRDDDGDSYTDCWDPDCKGNTYCVQNRLGVESSGYVDTTSPKILFWHIEKYPDAALLNFDSDEPTNGTVFFYGQNKSCLSGNLNATLYDVGIWNADTPNFKNWHEVELYNDGGINSLDYALENGTTYFYKFKVCDTAGNCAQSACANFTTIPSIGSCSKCSFIFNLDLPSSISLDLDLNNSGSYASRLHDQCGSSAGFLVNYTEVRSVNMKFTDSSTTPATEIYLIGARLTRSIMHNQEIRKINKAGGIKAGTTLTAAGTIVGYAGLDKEITNKLVDKLHPKSCMIKIPGTGTCDKLYHCDDSLGNCVDKTSIAILNQTGSNYCIWNIPCTFSTYAGGQPGTPTSNPPPGGSGGGGGGGGKALPSNAAGKASHTWDSIAAGQTTAMNINSELIAINGLTFTVKNQIKSVSLDVLSLKDKPAEIIVPDNTIYQYLQITTTMTEIDFTKAEIKFKVSKTWIDENKIEISSIVLNRYANNKWEKLTTKLLSSDATYYYFSSAASGFSYFAITGAAKTTAEEQKEALQEESKPIQEVTGESVSEEIIEEEQGKRKSAMEFIKNLPTTVITVIILAVVLILISLIITKKKNQGNKP